MNCSARECNEVMRHLGRDVPVPIAGVKRGLESRRARHTK